MTYFDLAISSWKIQAIEPCLNRCTLREVCSRSRSARSCDNSSLKPVRPSVQLAAATIFGGWHGLTTHRIWNWLIPPISRPCFMENMRIDMDWPWIDHDWPLIDHWFLDQISVSDKTEAQWFHAESRGRRQNHWRPPEWNKPPPGSVTGTVPNTGTYFKNMRDMEVRLEIIMDYHFSDLHGFTICSIIYSRIRMIRMIV